MSQQNQPSNYTQGYSSSTIATHLLRTAESDAAFLIPHIKRTDHILDVGCGPGTITTSLAKYASEGTTVGIDISTQVLQKARSLATEANIPTEGPGSVVFREGNVLEGLPYPDNTFDIAYTSQVICHMRGDMPLRAIIEIRRVLKPGGILATREGSDSHFYPKSSDLDRLWTGNMSRGFAKGGPVEEPVGSRMPALYRSAGFDSHSGKVLVGAGTGVISGYESRRWLAKRGAGQLSEGDAFRQSWLNAGITEEEIQETLFAVEKWAETEDAWFVTLHSETLGWK
jgi:ubiquinone/menaquinone biosynthesis C-methylase UbiE